MGKIDLVNNMDEIIRLENISKIYGVSGNQLAALDNINLTVKKGEYISIVGNSGSGKSTLMNIIGFLDKQTSGRYYFCGEESNTLKENRLAKIRANNIGFIFQGFNLIPTLSALDNVILPLTYKGISKKERTIIAKTALEKVGLLNRIKHYPNELSGGQCQRVAVARAIATKPNLILADEPTGNLDSSSGEQIKQLLFDLHNEGNTILLITHDKEFAARTPKTITIKDGRII